MTRILSILNQCGPAVYSPAGIKFKTLSSTNSIIQTIHSCIWNMCVMKSVSHLEKHFAPFLGGNEYIISINSPALYIGLLFTKAGGSGIIDGSFFLFVPRDLLGGITLFGFGFDAPMDTPLFSTKLSIFKILVSPLIWYWVSLLFFTFSSLYRQLWCHQLVSQHLQHSWIL